MTPTLLSQNSKDHDCSSGPCWLFCACLQPYWPTETEPWCFRASFSHQTVFQSWGHTPLTAELSACPHCYTGNSMRVKGLARKVGFLSPSKYLLWTVFIRQLVLVAAPSRFLSSTQMVVEKVSSLWIFWEGITLNTLYCVNVCLKSQMVPLKNFLHFEVKFELIWGDENDSSGSFSKAPSLRSIVRNCF